MIGQAGVLYPLKISNRILGMQHDASVRRMRTCAVEPHTCTQLCQLDIKVSMRDVCTSFLRSFLGENMLLLGSTKVRRTVFPVACARTLSVPLGTIIRLPVSIPLQFRVSCVQQEYSLHLPGLQEAVIWLSPQGLHACTLIECHP